MEYKELYIIFEGNDDERFLKNIINPILEKRGTYPILVPRAKKWRKARQLISSLTRRNIDYIYMEDINHVPSIEAKKGKIIEKIENVDKEKIVIVVKEIESWYLAGLNDNVCKQLRIPSLRETDNVFKEHLINMKPKRFTSTIDFMWEILKCFDAETAKRKNESFRYFCGKYL